MTFGMLELMDGIQMTIVLVSLFAVGEILYVARAFDGAAPAVVPIKGKLIEIKAVVALVETLAARHLSGFRSAPCRRRFGDTDVAVLFQCEAALEISAGVRQGRHRGRGRPEAANNSAAAGMLVPLLTLRTADIATAAVMLAAFQNYGLQPGPTLFTQNPELVWGLTPRSIGNTMLLVLNLPLVGLSVSASLHSPAATIYAGIDLSPWSACGTIRRSWIDLLIMDSPSAPWAISPRIPSPSRPC